MSHNIAASHPLNCSKDFTVDDGGIPTSSAYTWGRPLLTVAKAQGFEERGIRFLFNENNVVVNPWEDTQVTIQGEDLYALRALLAELPEEAFVEPKPSVKTPDWIEGDLVLYQSLTGVLTVTYTKTYNGHWVRTSSMSGAEDREYTDRDVEKRIAGNSDGSMTVLRRGGKQVGR